MNIDQKDSSSASLIKPINDEETSIKKADICNKIDRLIARYSQGIANNIKLSNVTQKELAKLICLLKRAKKALTKLQDIKNPQKAENKLSELKSAIDLIEIAVNTLGYNLSTLVFVETLRYHAEYTIDELVFPNYSKINNPWRRFWRNTKIPSKILFGFGLGILLNIGFAFIGNASFSYLSVNRFLEEVISTRYTSANKSLERILTPEETRENQKIIENKVNTNKNEEINALKSVEEFQGFILWIWICGTVGSAVSIFWRVLDDKDKDGKYSDDLIPIYIGAFKPLVGGISGLIIYFTLGSQIFPITLTFPDKYTQLLGFAVIGFVSGFSERLIKDIIDKTEDTFTGQETPTTQTVNSSDPENTENI